MDNRRLILLLVFSFSLIMLWDAWQRQSLPKSTAPTTTIPSLAAPAGLPAPIAAKWEALGKQMVTDPGFTELMKKLSNKASFRTGPEFARFVADGYKQMGELIPLLGLKPS